MEEYEKGRCAASIQRSASRRAACHEAALLKRAKTMERSAVISICSEPEGGGIAGAKEEVHALMMSRGDATGREGELKRWSEWAQERRILRWWRALCLKRVTTKKKEEGARRPSIEEGGTDPEIALPPSSIDGLRAPSSFW